MRHTISTVIVEERTLLREGLVALLRDTHYKVVASIAFSEIPHLKLSPGRALLIVLGVSRGIAETLRAVQNVRHLITACKIVAVAEGLNGHDLQKLLDGGFDAIVFDVDSSDSLQKTFDLVLVGQQVAILGPPLSAPPLAVDDTHAPIAQSESESDLETQMRLSEREQQILECVARGESNKTIARSCSITEATVKVHLQSILRKSRARNRTQAALWAVENGVVAKPGLTTKGANGERYHLDALGIAKGGKLSAGLGRK